MHGIVKNTSGTSGIWRSTGETSKVMATGSIEVSALSLKSGSGAATCIIYDASSLADATPTRAKWALDTSQVGQDNQPFPTPLYFKFGLVAVLETGADTNAILCVERVGQ